MQRSPRSRKIANLSQSVRRQLNMYAFGATAAGVGMLATLPAEGKIVYTPTQEQISPGFGVGLYLDLNHDGINDFSFVNFYSRTSSMIALWVSHVDANNGIYAHRNFAAALPAGVTVGPKGRFRRSNPTGMVSDDLFNQACYGPWKDARRQYLGLKFDIKGKTHFGWARLNVSCAYLKAVNATLTGYAYETIPNKAIITGKTKEPNGSVGSATLGHLARGAGAISGLRVRPVAETVTNP